MELTALPDPLAIDLGPTSKGRVGIRGKGMAAKGKG